MKNAEFVLALQLGSDQKIIVTKNIGRFKWLFVAKQVVIHGSEYSYGKMFSGSQIERGEVKKFLERLLKGADYNAAKYLHEEDIFV